MKIRPVFDRLTVEKVEQASKTQSGLIVLPDDARAPSQLGRVVAIGQGRNYDGPGGMTVRPQYVGAMNVVSAEVAAQREAERALNPVLGDYRYVVEYTRPAMVVKPGDLVIFGKYSGAEVEIDGTKVFILREDEVLGIVEESAAATETPAEPAPEEAPVH